MKRTILLIVLFAVVAASAAMVARREEVKAILVDAVRWFNYFIHLHLPGNPGGLS